MSASEASPFAPFRQRVFVILWIATVLGNVGGWARDTASAWAMTELAPSPSMVALVQAASMLPIFLLSLPAGALADTIDRRRMMIWIQVGLCAVSIALASLSAMGLLNPALLLSLALLAGTGAAFAGPVWQSIVPQLVPRGDLKPAVALNSLGVNISRAIGPALAGALIAAVGVWAAYLIDVASYAATLAALLWWRNEQAKPARPEHLGEAMRAGLRYAVASAPLRRVLLRAVLYFAPASCFWALLPLVARNQLSSGASGYGLLLGALGAGAIGGALMLPWLRARLGRETLALAAALATGATTAALASASSLAVAFALLLLCGAGWIAMVTTLNATAQGALPDWVRGRGLALYLTVFFGTMTLSSFVWGQVGSMFGLGAALSAAGIATIAGALLGRLRALPSSEADLTPAALWPEPAAGDLEPATGPILVTIEYRMPIERHEAFAADASPLGGIRRRDGAYQWGLMAEVSGSGAVTEWFLVASWQEHLRQRDRAVEADRAILERVRAYHEGADAPVVHHFAPVGSAAPPRAIDARALTGEPQRASER